MNKHASANTQIAKAVIINPSSFSKTFVLLLLTFIAEAGLTSKDKGYLVENYV